MATSLLNCDTGPGSGGQWRSSSDAGASGVAVLLTLKAGAGEMLISAGHKAGRVHGSKTAEPQS